MPRQCLAVCKGGWWLRTDYRQDQCHDDRRGAARRSSSSPAGPYRRGTAQPRTNTNRTFCPLPTSGTIAAFSRAERRVPENCPFAHHERTAPALLVSQLSRAQPTDVSSRSDRQDHGAHAGRRGDEASMKAERSGAQPREERNGRRAREVAGRACPNARYRDRSDRQIPVVRTSSRMRATATQRRARELAVAACANCEGRAERVRDFSSRHYRTAEVFQPNGGEG